MTGTTLTPRQQQILELIDRHTRERGYPPSVREIGEEVGLTSPSPSSSPATANCSWSGSVATR